MVQKTCKVCNKKKLINNFHKRIYGGYRPFCKECRSILDRIKYIINKSIQRNYEEFRDKLKQSKFCTKCGDYKSFDEFGKNKNGKYNLKSSCNSCNYTYLQQYRKENLNYRISTLLSNKLNNELKGRQKSKSIRKLLGCTIDELKNYLETQFEEGMTWNNYSKKGWHIDHVIPCSLFNLSDFKQQAVCFHWSNLQPLWEGDNCSKQNTITGFENLKIGFDFLNKIHYHNITRTC